MRFALIIAVFMLLSGVTCAQEQVPPAAASPTASFDFTDTDMAQAFATIAQKAQVTVLSDPSLKGKVSLSLAGVTGEQALTTICKLNKLVLLKIYTTPASETEKPTAAKLIALVDAVKALGGKSMLWEVPGSQTQGIFVPDAKPDVVAIPTLATGLNLKPVFLVRAEGEPKAAADAKATPKTVSNIATMVPPADPRAAAQELWGYFSQIDPQQRRDVMREIGHMMYENMTPEQREAMHQRWGDGRGRRDGQPGQPGPPMPGPPRQ